QVDAELVPGTAGPEQRSDQRLQDTLSQPRPIDRVPAAVEPGHQKGRQTTGGALQVRALLCARAAV
ncbi:hypothetical protein IscW_ISCW012396, partial [Ixodes scapularis]